MRGIEFMVFFLLFVCMCCLFIVELSGSFVIHVPSPCVTNILLYLYREVLGVNIIVNKMDIPRCFSFKALNSFFLMLIPPSERLQAVVLIKSS